MCESQFSVTSGCLEIPWTEVHTLKFPRQTSAPDGHKSTLEVPQTAPGDFLKIGT